MSKKDAKVYFKQIEKQYFEIKEMCEDVQVHYVYWKNNFNPNKDDCCNLRKEK